MSKFTKANEKIADTVVSGYKKVEDTVVGSYKKVEDKFVDTFLKKDGETTEEAKARIAAEQKAMSEKNKELTKNSIKTTEEIQKEIKEKHNL